MTELIKNARIGWMDYTETGKLAALLLLALLWFWFSHKESSHRYRALVLYTTVMTACCICPLTAAVLMTYQTRFYDYQWIWSMVPLTIVVALAGTLLWFTLTKKYAGGKNRIWKVIGITAVMLAVVFLCGPMMQNNGRPKEIASGQEEAARILAPLLEESEKKEITIWAPGKIMENARAFSGAICMPYGRNMWDPALNAYSYDTYGEAEHALWKWMNHAEETGEGSGAAECMDLAIQLGVTHILLPGSIEPQVLTEIEAYLELQAEKVEGYYLLKL